MRLIATRSTAAILSEAQDANNEPGCVIHKTHPGTSSVFHRIHRFADFLACFPWEGVEGAESNHDAGGRRTPSSGSGGKTQRTSDAPRALKGRAQKRR